MPDREIVKIEISPSIKMTLARQISERMEKLGLGGDISKLELGFALPENWPADMNDQPTMAQLIVLAQKLKMQIVFSDLNLFANEP